MTRHTPHMAVITGDLVASGAMSPDQLADAMTTLANSATAQAGWHDAPLHFSRHRGDGWQVALPRPELALRAALHFRASLRALDDTFDSYISIATGPMATTMQDLNSRNDPVFVTSGRGLDQLKQHDPQRMTHANGGAAQSATILADHLTQGWTRAQATAILPLLPPDSDTTLTAIAQSLGKSRQTVTKSLHSAGWQALHPALNAFEQRQTNDL